MPAGNPAARSGVELFAANRVGVGASERLGLARWSIIVRAAHIPAAPVSQTAPPGCGAQCSHPLSISTLPFTPVHSWRPTHSTVAVPPSARSPAIIQCPSDTRHTVAVARVFSASISTVSFTMGHGWPLASRKRRTTRAPSWRRTPPPLPSPSRAEGCVCSTSEERVLFEVMPQLVVGEAECRRRATLVEAVGCQRLGEKLSLNGGNPVEKGRTFGREICG